MPARGRFALALELGAVGSGQTLVDWGCAHGWMAMILAERHPDARVIACDISYANGAPDFGEAPIEYHVLDERNPELPLEDGSVDRIFMLEVLEHMGPASRTAALAEIRRLIEADGRLVVSVPFRGRLHWTDPENVRYHLPRLHELVFTLARGRASYRERYELHDHPNYSSDAVEHHHYRADELAAQLRAAGFEVETRTTLGVLYIVPWTLTLCVSLLSRLTKRELAPLQRFAGAAIAFFGERRPPLAWADGIAVSCTPAPVGAVQVEKTSIQEAA